MEDAEVRLARRLAAFTATLRGSGFSVGLHETEDAGRILASPLAATSSSLRPALRALFAGKCDEWRRFDELFDAFFLGRHVRSAVRTSAAVGTARPKNLREIAAERAATGNGSETSDTTAEAMDRSSGRAMREGASPGESRTERAMRGIADPEALAEAEAIARTLSRRLLASTRRRQRLARRGRRLDLRRTLRRALARGGTPIDLAWRRPRVKPLRIALLVDVSGSMEPFTPLFIRFALGMMHPGRRTEAFLMHTRLVEVTAALRDRDPERALDKLTLLSKGIGGGTRLGESLALFNRRHARRALAGRAACLILSDGYETGDPDLLGREMASLRKRCRRLVWLNPLAGEPGYQPLARGMQAALPHLALFAAAGNVRELADLAERLARIPGMRHGRADP